MDAGEDVDKRGCGHALDVDQKPLELSAALQRGWCVQPVQHCTLLSTTTATDCTVAAASSGRSASHTLRIYSFSSGLRDI